MLNSLLKSAISTNGQARWFAIEQTVELANLIPPTVSYQSQGHLLIIGSIELIQNAALQLQHMTSITLLTADSPESAIGNTNKTPLNDSLPKHCSPLYFASSIQISGYLGEFDVEIIGQVGETNEAHNLALIAQNLDTFDIVLDLSQHSVTHKGYMDEQVSVPGYFPVGETQQKLPEAVANISELIGTFDKPKYFRLNTDLCAHSSRGLKGCERCIDSCPAGALTSVGTFESGHNIEINPYLCQGVGTCATSCPTEAIQYALPSPKETQLFIERTLANYKKVGGESPIILICSREHERYNTMALKALPENIIPILVDELPSIGIDTWFSALVNGATQVLFAASKHMPPTILKVLNHEIDIAQSLLQQLGLARGLIDILYLESLREPSFELFIQNLSNQDLDINIGEVNGDKRTRLFSALDALSYKYQPEQLITKLPNGAPYGEVSCNTQDCTLCMACVAVCPTRALHTADIDSPTQNMNESPAIQFIEKDCIQCGLCEKACPENALITQPQFNWDIQQRDSVRILHQEAPAKCIRCQKPFAPQSMITMLQNKLRGHSHFSDPIALNRIAMCEDCRVVDMFESMASDPMQQLKY